MDRAKLDEIISITSAELQQSGFECLETEWVPSERILRLFVDHIGGGQTVTIEDCVAATGALREFEELDNMVDGKYRLEVSSPGVERPLRKSEHFEKHIGERIDVRLTQKIGDRRKGSGELLSVESKEDGVHITIDTTEGSWCFPLSALKQAALVFDWDKKK